ncbi:MAG: putative bifunctional diguanylate cyclase/phosphodiesterase, partial [Pseudomonadota bacterium]
MLELRDTIKEPKTENVTSPEVPRFLQTDRSRTQKMVERSPLAAGFSVKKILHVLQNRFSHTGDLPQAIEEMVEAQVELRTRELFRQANYDDLTHLPNRAYFYRTLEQLVMSTKDNSTEFTLLFLDLDGFKNINDTLGHHAGDELLRNVSARLMSAVREGDVVSRLGGDEFVILLAGLSDRTMTETICNRLIFEVSRPYWIDKNGVAISTSIGVARYPQDAKSSADLVENSDKALYVSKSCGRSTYRFYADIAEKAEDKESDLTASLKTAINAGEIEVCFEPQIDLVSQKIVGASVSALWQSESAENPYLAGWMDKLDHSSWASSVGTWLIDSGLFYLQQWQQVNDELVISLPVMESVWKTENMVEFMDHRLATFNVKASQVQLEFSLQAITEAGLQSSLQALSDAGYQITLTQVGKVPLDLAQLMNLNLQEIKLDHLWLQEALENQNGQKWLKAVIQMAKTLDLCVIATGIENRTQAT